MEATEVTARFDLQGKIYPEQFTWRGATWQVGSVGRRWKDEAGEHILVTVVGIPREGLPIGERVFELLFAAKDWRWYLRPVSPPDTAA